MKNIIAFTTILFLAVVLGCAESQPISSDVEKAGTDETVVSNSSDEVAAKRELESLKQEFEAKFDNFKESLLAAKTDQEKLELANHKDPIPGFVQDLKKLAAKYHETKTGFESALEAVSRSSENAKDQAMQLLIEKFASRLEYSQVLQSLLRDMPSKAIEGWIRSMIEFAPSDKDKATAMLSFAQYVDQIPSFRDGFEKNPHLLNKLPPDHRAYLLRERTETERSEVVGLLKTVIKDYPEGNYRRGTFGEYAKKALFEIENLSVGMTAPEIVGHDLDGIEFRLSDYRGKVVMLDFWGHWCGPCRRMYPEERDMVEKLAGTPFALIGMNSDHDVEFARDAVREEGLSWRHFWNGPGGTLGPIAEQWNIEAWPTVYLIDGKGTIRYKDILGDDLHRAIESLLAESGHEVQLSP